MRLVPQKIILFCILTLLTACGSTGYYKPLSKAPYSRPAQDEPKELTEESILSDALLNEAGNEGVSSGKAYSDDAFLKVLDEQLEIAAENGVQVASANGYPFSGSSQRAAITPSVTRVAILIPLTGKYKALGQSLLNSAQMALFDLGYEGFELMPRDTKGTSQGARQAAESALQSGAQLIIGPLFADSVKAVKPVARRNNVNVIAFSTDWTLAGQNTYIMGFLPFTQVQRVAEYAAREGYRNIGIFAPNTDYGNAVVSAYNATTSRLGLPPPMVTRFEEGNRDITNDVRTFARFDQRSGELDSRIRQLEAQLSQDPSNEALKQDVKALASQKTSGSVPYDAVLLPVGGAQVRSIANLLTFYEMPPNDVQRLGTGLWDDEGLATEAGLKGGWFSAPAHNQRASFESRYHLTYGQAAPRLSTLSYDATALAIILSRTSMQRYGRPVFLPQDIANPNGFSGLDGVFRFRPDGLVERGLPILEFQNGRIKVVDPAPKTFERSGYNAIR